MIGQPPYPPARPLDGGPGPVQPYVPAPGHGGHRPLTRAEQVFAAFEVGNPQGGGLSPLQQAALLWLNLSEASGTRFDSTHFDHDFTEVGTVPVVAGLQGMNAGDFPATGGGADILTLPAQPSVLVADAAWSGSVWLWSDNVGPSVPIGHTSSTAGTAQKWRLVLNGGLVTFGQLDIVPPTYRNVTVAFAAGAWHHLYFQYDEPGNLVGISQDNAALVTAAWSGTPQVANHPMTLGDQIAAGFLPYDGRLQFFGLFNRLLTAAERSALYNGGLGASWAML